MKLKLKSVRLDGDTQPRQFVNEDVVADYAELLLEDTVFPPVVVFHDGANYWLADGFHRVEAADEADLKTIVAEIRQGSKRDATLYACGANRDHGLRRSRADVRRAITTLVQDAEWGQMANRAIADKVGCSPTTVGTVRDQLSNLDSSTTEPDTTTSEDQLRNFRSCDDEPDLEGAKADTPPPPPPAPAPAPPAKRIGRDGKTRAMPIPKAAPTPAPQSAPAVNKARLAMRAAHGLAAALTALEPLEVDLLREDAETVMANLRAALARLELRFGGEVRGHA